MITPFFSEIGRFTRKQMAVLQTAVFIVFIMLSVLLVSETAVAQQAITPPYIQNFESLGGSATASLPTNWRVDKITTARTLGTWAAAVSATEQRAGNNMATNAANGIYNFGAGDQATATDRAVGWISSSSATKSGNLYLELTNNTGAAIQALTVAYDVEKYRNGTNAAGFSIQMYYSTNGSTWTSAGSSFLTSFPGGDAANTGFASAPGVTTAVNSTLIFAAPIPTSQTFYLAWNYAVTSGTTTSNAQALGLDNVNIAPTITPDGNLSDWDAVSQKLGATNGVDYYLTWDATYLYVGFAGGDATGGNDKYNVAVDIDPNDTGSNNSGTTTAFNGVTFGADGKPDYVVLLNNDNTVYKKSGASNWIDDWTSANSTAVDNNTNPGQVEFRLNWADMGLTDRSNPVGIYVWQSNNADLSWGSYPPTNLGWTGGEHPLTTRIYLPTTDNGRLPRFYAQHKGDETQFNANGAFTLLNGFAQINVTGGGGADCNFKVAVRGNAASDTNNSAVRRQYIIEPTGCTPTADMTLRYMDGDFAAPDERNGYADTSALKLFRWNGSAWVDEGGTANDAANTVAVTGISTFSPWTFGTGTGPTAVSLQSFTSATNPTLPLLLSAMLVLLLLGSTLFIWQRRRR